MSLNILGGMAKGFILKTSKKISYRPTSIMLRRKFFDQNQRWDDLIFVDLCAGSGAMGFEALSRGAKHVYFNDENADQIQCLKENFKLWCDRYPEDEKKVSMIKGDFSKFVKNYTENDESWFFFDPPYEHDHLYQKFIDLLKSLNFHKKFAIVMEFSVQGKRNPTWWNDFELFRNLESFREVEASGRKIVSFKGE